MPAYEVTLKGKETIAEGTAAFRLEKPAGFRFQAGQAVNLALLQPPSEPNSARRTFSLACAPYEDELVVATRMRDGSAYKRALGALAAGARLKLTGPLGSMTLHEERSRPALMVAGGIGITPFLSMLRQAAHERLAQDLVLLYSNRSLELAAYLPELKTLAARNPRFRLEARTGIVDAAMVKDALGGVRAPVAYLAGPPGMVEAAKAALAAAGIPADDVHSEEFYGY